MTLNTTYGPRFQWAFASEDGETYRVTLSRAGYSGPVRGVVGDGCVLAWSGVQGDALSALSPVAASEMRLRLVDNQGGIAGEVEGSPDGAWRGTLHLCANPDGEPDAADVLEWTGYLFSARRDESEILPGITATGLLFYDGLGMIKRAFAGAGAETPTSTGDVLTPTDAREPVLRSILRVLGPLGGGDRTAEPAATWTDLRVAVQWFARVYEAWGAGSYTQTPGTSDPLAYLATLTTAWLSSDGDSVGAGDALRTVIHRLGARLYQSGGAWRIDQPGLLARNPAAVPVHVYPATDGSGGAAAYESEPGPGEVYEASTTAEDWGFDPTPTAAETEDRMVDLHDTPGLFVQVGDARGSALPVRTVESTYTHGPLGNLIFNPSFETARPGTSGAGADGWTQSADADRILLTGTQIEGMAATVDDEYAMSLGATGTRSVVSQDVSFPIAASTANVFTFSGAMVSPGLVDRVDAGGVALGMTRPDGTVLVSTEVTVTLAARVLPGKGARLFFETTVHDGAVSPTPDATAVMFPAGTVLSFARTTDPEPQTNDASGTATLLEPVLWGSKVARADVVLEGDVTDYMEPDDVARAHVWTSGTGRESLGSALRSFSVFTHLQPVSIVLSGTADDGRPVEGRLSVVAIGANPAATPLTGYADDFDLRLSLSSPTNRTQEARATTGRATKPAGSSGTDAALPIPGAVSGGWPVGDGPLPDSPGGMVVYASRDGASLDPVPTTAAGHWQAAPHTGDAPDVPTGLEALAATEALALAGWADVNTGASGPLATARAVSVLHPSPGVPAFRLRPHHVRRVWVPAALVYPATLGTDTLVLTRPARPGGLIRLSDGGDALLVESVAGGAGGWAVTLTGTAPASLPAGSPVWIALPMWWTSSAWDVITATVDDNLVELGRDPTTPILQTALSA